MTPFVIPPPEPTTLAVAGSAAVFPVNRVYCIGRNYAWSADEPPPREMPAWFMKPANAVVPAQGTLPYHPAPKSSAMRSSWSWPLAKADGTLLRPMPTSTSSATRWAWT